MSEFQSGSLVDFRYRSHDSPDKVRTYYLNRLVEDPKWKLTGRVGNTIYFESRRSGRFQATLDIYSDKGLTYLHFTGD
jgi:hypothetical protein